MKKVFLTFADQRMVRALHRIEKQAIAMDIYDAIVMANEHCLDLSFRENFADRLKPGIRGFGYWVWKPQIILQVLLQMKDGDLLQYSDVGCHLNPKGRNKLENYFLKVNESETGILAFQAIPPAFHNKKIKLLDLRESSWCKGDLFDYFEVRDKPSIVETQTIGSGIIFIKKCANSIRIISEWLAVYEKDFYLADDSLSKSKNLLNFIEHRHDQSIFAILAKINKVDIISAYEYWYPDGKNPPGPDWKILKDYPIHAKRDRGVHWARRMYDFPGRVFKKIRRIINRGK